MNNTELMLSLDNYDIEVTASGKRGVINVKPDVIDLKVTDAFYWWNRPTIVKLAVYISKPHSQLGGGGAS